MPSQSVFYGSFDLNNNSGGYYCFQRSLGTVQIVQAISQIARQPGVKIHGEWTGPRTIKIGVKVLGTSRTDLEAKLDALSLALDQRNQQLTLHQADGRYFIANALYQPLDLGIGDAVRATLLIDMLCQQPYALAATPSSYDTASQNLTFTGSWWTFPSTISIAAAGTKFAVPTIVVTNRQVAGAVGVTLATGLTSGTAYTSITVSSATSVTLYAGDHLVLTYMPGATHTQTIVVSTTTAPGATTIPVTSFQANYSYPGPPSGAPSYIQTNVTQDVGWNFFQIQQTTDQQFLQINPTSSMVNANGATLTLVCDPGLANGWSVVDSTNPGNNLAFSGYPPDMPVASTNFVILIGAQTNNPVAEAQWTWAARYLS